MDLTIVRGLDYYTGLVFELFDRKKANGSLAGGGRYDDLVRIVSDGSVDLPAAGFAIGDLVLANLIKELDHAKQAAIEALERRQLAFFVVIADEGHRPEALQLVSSLRRNGASVDFALQAAKVGRQFQTSGSGGSQSRGRRRSGMAADPFENLRDRTEPVLSSSNNCVRTGETFSEAHHDFANLFEPLQGRKC